MTITFGFASHWLKKKKKVARVLSTKGRTIRKVMGGGGGLGDFQLARYFFFRPLLVQEFFFSGETLCTIFFSDKYCFVCHLLIKKNYFIKELLYFVDFNNN